MPLEISLIIFGILVHVIGSSFYIWDIITGKIQPNKITWGVISFTTGIVFFAQASVHLSLTLISIGLLFLIPFTIFCASFFNPKAHWELQKIDYACLILSIIGIALWIATKNPLWAIIFSILADFFACVPTWIKTYTHPQSESPWGYVGALINTTIGLLFVSNLFSQDSIFSLYIIFSLIVQIGLIIRGYFLKKKV